MTRTDQIRALVKILENEYMSRGDYMVEWGHKALATIIVDSIKINKEIIRTTYRDSENLNDEIMEDNGLNDFILDLANKLPKDTINIEDNND